MPTTDPAVTNAPTLTKGEVLTAAEVASLLVIPKSTIEEWARRGTIPSRKRGKRRIFIRAEVAAWLIADD